MSNEKNAQVIQPSDLAWRPSNMMKIPNADYLERTGTELMGARLWRLPPGSANTLHRHIKAEEFYFVISGTGRIRVDGQSYTLQPHGGIWVKPAGVRQIFNDTDTECLWLIFGAPEREEAPGEARDLSRYYPESPTQLPPELAGKTWPPAG